MNIREELIERIKAHPSFRYIPSDNPDGIYYWNGIPSYKHHIAIRLYPKSSNKYCIDKVEDYKLVQSMGIPPVWKEEDMELVTFILSEFGYGIIESVS